MRTSFVSLAFVLACVSMVSFAADKEPNGWPQADTLEGGHLDEQGGACQRARWDLRGRPLKNPSE